MLQDRFGRTIDYLRISVTDRCDLRCAYCIPKGFRGFEIPESWLSIEEITRVVNAFAQLGTRRIRLTGGEPLLRKDLVPLVKQISGINGIHDLSLSTNATRLALHAYDLRRAGLNRINVSLDSLRGECVREITGNDSLPKVLHGLRMAKGAGFGAASHGAGTARSYELGQQEGVVASLVMMLSGVTMVLIAPLVAWVMF